MDATKRPRSIPVRSDQTIQFSFSNFDALPDWSNECDAGSYFPVVAAKLKHYESMKWPDIVARDHRVPKDRLIRAAQDRLVELNLDDVDELWRLQLDGLTRLWGIRVGNVLHCVWWDPKHKVCPSKLRHT